MQSSALEGKAIPVKVSLKYKFAVFTSLLILLVCATLSLFLIEKVEDELKRQIHLRGMSTVSNFVQNAKYSLTTRDHTFLKALVEREIAKEDIVHVIILNENGEVIGHNNPSLLGRKLNDEYNHNLLETLEQPRMLKILGKDGEYVYDFATPILDSDIYTADRYSDPKEARSRLPERKNLGVIRIGISFKKMEESMRETYNGVLLISLGIALLSIILAFWYGKLLIKPLSEMTRTASRLASGYLDERVDIKGNDEISLLAENFNTMAKSLQESRSNLWKLNKDLEYIIEDRTAEVKKAYQELRQIDELKSGFLSTVSHELRTPLTSILGFSKMIQKQLEKNIIPALPEEPKITKAKTTVLTNLDIIVVESNRLARLINDVLDLAKIESGKMNWKAENYNLADLFERAVQNVQGLVEGSNVVVELKVSREESPDLQGDADRILQVITNLLSNAIKFTKDGKIICSIQNKGDYLQASVKDPGIGIAEADLLKIFDKFLQVGDTLTNKPQGTGLGLSICKEIIEYHKGQIWADSTLGKGSTFYVALPLNAEIPVPVTVKEVTFRLADKLEKMTRNEYLILIADEDPDVRNVLQDALEREGYRTIQAVNGKEAFDLALEYPVNAILLDIIMYEIDGFDTPHHLKSNDKTKSIPIVLLSIIQSQKKEFCLGATAYLTEPIEAEKILNRVAEVTRKQGSTPLQDTVLYFLGFSRHIRKPWTVELKNMGIRLEFFDSFVQLKKAAEQKLPTVVFVDFQEARISPNSFFKTWRNQESTAELPIIATIHAAPIARAIDAQPMRKIFTVQDILASVHELFTRSSG